MASHAALAFVQGAFVPAGAKQGFAIPLLTPCFAVRRQYSSAWPEPGRTFSNFTKGMQTHAFLFIYFLNYM
jgi:hypothetical protein